MTWLRRGRKICLALSPDSQQGCASERRALKGRLPSTLKYLAESNQRGMSDPDEEAQKSPVVITVDSPKRASSALLAL